MSSSLEPRAVILAAGVGRRLGVGHKGPKSLLAFGGRTLVARLLGALRDNGVSDISITVGYEQEAIRSEVARLGLDGVEFVENPRFEEGSLVSLWTQRERLLGDAPVILMDADVLCDPRMVGRLFSPGDENLLLLDRQIEPGDEPVKICMRGDTIVDFRKIPEHPHEWFGESVGFFRLAPDTAAEVWARCDAYMGQGRSALEYEEAIRDVILATPSRFRAVDVSDLPWTEIDFETDVIRARDVILPELIA